jgi:hypothetical protein
MCPGPAEETPCPLANNLSDRRAGSLRCIECAAARERIVTSEYQRKTRAYIRSKKQAVKSFKGIKKAFTLVNKPIPGEIVRKAVKRCRACLGCPHMREQGRIDDYGIPVCLPGMARCRVCWEPWAPLPILKAQGILGSSAGTAAAARYF